MHAEADTEVEVMNHKDTKAFLCAFVSLWFITPVHLRGPSIEKS
jgi:hypothetical protein